jgi:hypothetical protein
MWKDEVLIYMYALYKEGDKIHSSHVHNAIPAYSAYYYLLPSALC